MSIKEEEKDSGRQADKHTDRKPEIHTNNTTVMAIITIPFFFGPNNLTKNKGNIEHVHIFSIPNPTDKGNIFYTCQNRLRIAYIL